MDEQLELRIDKFTFRFPTNLVYSEDGLWMRREGDRFRLGISDFAQQRSGDIAFANPAPPGTVLKIGDEIASVETVKVNVSLPSPVKGRIVEVNPALQDAAELINQEPYARGWIAVVEPDETDQQPSGVLDAPSYLEVARRQAEAELNS